MEKFIRLFEDTKHGQIAAIILESAEEGGPEIKFYFKPKGMGVCNSAINYKEDSKIAWADAEKRFYALTKEAVVTMVDDILKAFEGE